MLEADIYTDYGLMLGVLHGIINDDPRAKMLFASADFRASVAFRWDRLKEETARKLAEAEPDKQKPDPQQASGSDGSTAAPELVHWIVSGPAEAKDCLRYLRRWLRGAREVTICDPYLLAVRRSKVFATQDEYVNGILNLLPPSATSVKFFGRGLGGNVKKLLKRQGGDGRNLRFFSTEEIHDRYIIRDGSEGRMVGTSFGGFGSKLFTVLPLPPEDVAKLRGHLHQIERAGRGC